MMNRIGRRSTIVLFLIALLLLTSYLVFITLFTPFLGISAEVDNNNQWKISKIEHNSWAEKQGIRVGDIVSLVNDKVPNQLSTLTKYNVIEGAKKLELIHSGERVIYLVSQVLSTATVIDNTLIPSIMFIILLSYSIILYVKKGTDRTVLVLILFLLAVGTAYLSAGGSSRVHFIAIIVNRLAFLTIPILFLHFLHRYFQDNQLHAFHRRMLHCLYFLAGILILVEVGFSIVNLGSNYLIYRTILLLFFSANISLGFIFLVVRYVQYRKTSHKPILKLLTLGILVAFFPFVCLSALPLIIFGVEIVPASVAALFLLFVPYCFAYLITVNRFLDIDFLITRFQYYGILSLIPSAFSIIGLRLLFNPHLQALEWIQLTCFTYIGFAVFLYFKEELDFRINLRLFSQRDHFQDSLNRFSHVISKIMKVSDLEERLLKEIRNVLQVPGISLLELNKEHQSLEWRRGDVNFPHDFTRTEILNKLPDTRSNLIVCSHGICIIISEKVDKYFLLWLSNKANRTQFNLEEKKYLGTIASYVSMVYENLFLIEGLTEEVEYAVNTKSISAPPWVLRFLFSLSEKERQRLAYDLHDSILQDLMNFHRELLDIIAHKQLEQTIPSNMIQRLTSIQEGLLDVANHLRDTCNQLRPPFIKEYGISETLGILITSAQLKIDCNVHINTKQFTAELDHEPIITIYRIVQELLSNTKKYAQATSIDITLYNEDNVVYLSYWDNGIGVRLEDVEPSFQHMGLSGIRERVASLEGETSIISTPGKGFEVYISFPINERGYEL